MNPEHADALLSDNAAEGLLSQEELDERAAERTAEVLKYQAQVRELSGRLRRAKAKAMRTSGTDRKEEKDV